MIIDDQERVFRFSASPTIINNLEAAGVYFGHRVGERRLRDRDIITSLKGPILEPYVSFTYGYHVFSLGFASYSNSMLPIATKVGRYCSIATNVRIMGGAHPLERVTSHPITYMNDVAILNEPTKALGGANIKATPVSGKPIPTLGNDVWIGQDVLIARGVVLADGCAVAAGSVVTKSVPPYAIVGGNPARVIRYRFSEKIIERMLEIRWWRFAFPHFSDLSLENPETFLDGLEEKISKKDIAEYEPTKIDLYQLIKSM